MNSFSKTKELSAHTLCFSLLKLFCKHGSDDTENRCQNTKKRQRKTVSILPYKAGFPLAMLFDFTDDLIFFFFK